MDYLYYDTESIRLRCITHGFNIKAITAVEIRDLLHELGFINEFSRTD